MSILTYTDLFRALASGVLRADPTNPQPYHMIPQDNVNGSSIDVRLGRVFWQEVNSDRSSVVDLANKECLPMQRLELDWGESYYLRPEEFILAQTLEEFYLPADLSAEFRLKSSPARSALNQSLAVWCDPTWHGSTLTLELKNISQYHTLLLRPGMKIGQVIFHEGEPVPADVSYAVRGQYNNDKEATGNKGIR